MLFQKNKYRSQSKNLELHITFLIKIESQEITKYKWSLKIENCLLGKFEENFLDQATLL